ncbi:hypothetical protein VCO01S_03420 [Vibrio comitans NBRC 102076]|uniref:Uncharacterized protein n=1 Tax=Vibrio comitans NBRC 102076 TaxID=1219078 RepID=A0A4Y3II03_9VIBR|nr:hypothetical protein VCO01S_03420 [Vibrio comitans NBRC 102076]
MTHTKNLKAIASFEFNSGEELRQHYIDLIGSPFFVGPLTEEEAIRELQQSQHPTPSTNLTGYINEFPDASNDMHSALLYSCEDSFYIVYPF